MEEIKKLLLLVLGCAVQVNLIKDLKNILMNLLLFLDWENPHEDHCYMNKCLAQDSLQSKSLILDEWNYCRREVSMGKGDTVCHNLLLVLKSAVEYVLLLECKKKLWVVRLVSRLLLVYFLICALLYIYFLYLVQSK